MTSLPDTDRARPLLGKRGAFEGVARWPWMASGMGTDDAQTPTTNRSHHSAQRVVEKVGRSITNSETPHRTHHTGRVRDEGRRGRDAVRTPRRPAGPNPVRHTLRPHLGLRCYAATGCAPQPGSAICAGDRQSTDPSDSPSPGSSRPRHPQNRFAVDEQQRSWQTAPFSESGSATASPWRR
jgi:hypothetical protein